MNKITYPLIISRSWKLKNLVLSVLFLRLIGFNDVSLIFGQNIVGNPKIITDRIFEARKVTASLMSEYTWNCRTEVTKDGKVMDILIDLVKVGPDGQFQYFILNDKGAKLPSGFIIHQIAEDEKNKLVTFLHGMKTFLERYSLPAESEILGFISKAKIQQEEAENMILMLGGDVIQPGDRLSWWVDKTSFITDKIVVSTKFEGDQVEFTATFKSLSDGLNYMAFAEASIPAKNLILQIQNFDYIKKESGVPK